MWRLPPGKVQPAQVGHRVGAAEPQADVGAHQFTRGHQQQHVELGAFADGNGQTARMHAVCARIDVANQRHIGAPGDLDMGDMAREGTLALGQGFLDQRDLRALADREQRDRVAALAGREVEPRAHRFRDLRAGGDLHHRAGARECLVEIEQRAFKAGEALRQARGDTRPVGGDRIGQRACAYPGLGRRQRDPDLGRLGNLAQPRADIGVLPFLDAPVRQPRGAETRERGLARPGECIGPDKLCLAFGELRGKLLFHGVCDALYLCAHGHSPQAASTNSA